MEPSGTIEVAFGSEVDLKIAPNSGYKISNVKVDGASVGSVSKYTFTNVTFILKSSQNLVLFIML